MDRRGSGFKKILNEYRSQPTYTQAIEPEFYSDNDSFLLILKNLNYNRIVLINKGRRSARTVENMKKIRQYLARNNGAKTNDIAKMMELSTARTRAF